MALILGAACAWASHTFYVGRFPHLNGGDFGFAWRAAQWLLAGESPYTRMDPLAAYGVAGPFLYPLPAAFAALPFAGLEVSVAASVFVGVSATLFAYGLSAAGWWRLTAMVSPPFLFSVQTANWPPVLAASALLPALGWLAVVKPNLGVVSLVYAPSRLAFGGIGVIVVVSLLLRPGWPVEWLGHIGEQPIQHYPALFWPLGVVGLAGLFRWRTREGRALAALTVVPTATLPYDWLLLWLCARSGLETAALTAVAWGTWLTLLATGPHNLADAWTVGHLLLSLGWILPAAVIVLKRPNVGAVPSMIERALVRLPAWVRGRPASAEGE